MPTAPRTPARTPARAAEAQRNRAALLAAAAQAFATAEAPSLEAIAREAGVGIGTLYRHFPRREALVAAVYADQIDRLGTRARSLLRKQPAVDALRQWLSVFLDWAATKHGMADTLAALMTSGDLTHDEMRARLIEIVTTFLDAGRADGTLRTDVAAADVAATFAGVLVVAGTPPLRAQALRMLGLLVDGLRP